MAKFKAPKNFGGITRDGETFKADKKGNIALPDDFPLDVAAAHGLVPSDDAAAEDPATETDPAAGGAGAGA
ncbi:MULTISPECIES: hypothetical protein [Burkholderia cepacia complex]|uniref:hypothetical protein n=1 Tax=Burkholderia cepacia complex TaxID=87882 RepID=UPI0006689F61|nr:MULTISPECIES: hypothetical protein [Burkholderia cepacia complex]RQS84338.1 hypothetical protein DF032_04550 [Burkholderia seminalis]